MGSRMQRKDGSGEIAMPSPLCLARSGRLPFDSLKALWLTLSCP